jgi:hypothetical protein
MDYKTLTNEEIVFLYFVSSEIVSQYETTIKSKSITQTLPTNTGSVDFKIDLSKDFIDEIESSKHYTIMKDINIKLAPIYNLIKEAEPYIVDRISEIFKNKKY